SRKLRTQYTDLRRIDRIDEHDGVGIAHRHRAELDGTVPNTDDIPVALRARPKRQRRGREARHAEVDADEALSPYPRVDGAGEARKPHLALGRTAAGRDEPRDAACPVAALL